MKFHDEIARVAYELYEKSGCIPGRDHENWCHAERIVIARHASQETAKPVGETAKKNPAAVKETSGASEKARPAKKSAAVKEGAVGVKKETSKKAATSEAKKITKRK